jgi:hypothetical protein
MARQFLLDEAEREFFNTLAGVFRVGHGAIK